MSEYAVQGQELKTLIKVARKKPISFAFNPAQSDPEHWFGLHRKKAPKILLKAAKDEGEGTKIAFGYCKVDSKVMALNCERVVPNMAKRVKKYLKSQKITLNIEIFGPDGAVIESDIEEGLPDDPSIDGDEGDDAGASENAETKAQEAGAEKAALAKLLSALKAKIEAAPAGIAGKLSGPFKKVLELYKKGDFKKAASGIKQIEAALSKAAPEASSSSPDLSKLSQLLESFRTQLGKVADPNRAEVLKKALDKAAKAIASGDEGVAKGMLAKIRDALKTATIPAPPPDAPAPPDPRAMKLAQLLKNFRGQLDRVTDADQKAEISKELDKATALVRGSELDKATEVLAKTRDLLTAAIKAAEQAAKDARNEIPDAPEKEDVQQLSESQQKAQDIWEKAKSELESPVNNALTKGLVEDVDGLREAWKWAVNNAGASDFQKAVDQLPKIRNLLNAKNADGKSAFEAEIPNDVKPFAESRLNWGNARSTMKSEIGKLAASIKDVCGDDEFLQIAAANTDNLIKELDSLDDQLESKLDKIVNSKPGADRDALKTEARAILHGYKAELDNDFLKDIDQGNGFASINVASTAMAALNRIETVLA